MIPYPLILRFARRGAGIVLFCGLTAGLFGWFLSSTQTPIYRSSATFIISPTNSSGDLDFGDVVYGIDTLSRRNTIATYAEVFGSERVFDMAVDNLNIPIEQRPSYTHQAVALPETSIIRVIVEGPNPETTMQLVQEMSQNAAAIMTPLFDAYALTSLDYAKMPVQPIKPNERQDVVLATLIGLILGIILAIIRTPEIITGSPEQFLAQQGIAGSVPLDPRIVYKMRPTVGPQTVEAMPSRNGNGVVAKEDL